MPWVPRPNAGPDEFDWVDDEPLDPAPASSPTTGPKWTDPDNPRQDWLYDGQTRPQDIGHPPPDGMFWDFDPMQGMWVVKQIPKTTTTPTLKNPEPVPTPTGGGGGGQSYSANWPSYTAPGYLDPGPFDPGDPFSFEDFSYQDFSAPTADSMLNDDGFKFRMDQGRKALEASAAGRGTLRSGGTLKDILQYGQNFASQEYGNVWNRALQEYDTNRSNAFGNYQTKRQNAWDNWNTGYGGKKDAYSFLADNYGRQNVFNQNNSQFDFNARQRQAEAEFDDAFRRWSKEGDWIVGSGAD